jgi:hypothetical protein
LNAEDEFRDAARAVADLIFTEDDVLLDSLHNEVQDNLVPPLSMLIDPPEGGRSLEELLVAAKISEEVARNYRAALPTELIEKIDSMAARRNELERSVRQEGA